MNWSVNKEAYIRVFDGYLFGYHKVELTGMCKHIEGGPCKKQVLYQAQWRIFGLPLKKYWIDERDLFFFDKQKESVRRCCEGVENE